MRWEVTNRADPTAREIADRHYNRQAVGAAQFVPLADRLAQVTETDDGQWARSLVQRLVQEDTGSEGVE